MDYSPHILSALEQLTQQLDKLNVFYNEQQAKQDARPLREQESTPIDPSLADRIYKPRYSPSAAEAYGPPNATAAFSQPDEYPQGSFKRSLSRMAEWGTNAAEDPTNRAPDSGRSTQKGSLVQKVNDPLRGMASSNESVMTLALLGEHGGPAVLRNAALDVYGMQRSLSWAQGAGQEVFSRAKSNFGDNSTIALGAGALNGVISKAADHPLAAYTGMKMLQGVGAINAHLSTMQTIGQQFGYGGPPGGMGILGLRNPLGDVGTAAGVGLSFDLEKQNLMGRLPNSNFGGGLTSKQATDVMDSLGNQGFAMQPSSLTGDASTIAQQFMAPLMQKFPGIGAQDLAQFTPALRQSGTSVQQLTDSLSNLGIEAKAAKETVGGFTTSVFDTAKQFESMGSTMGGGIDVGTGFNHVTGLDPRYSAQLAQNPLFQAMGVTQGILPSGLGDVNPGLFANMGSSEVQMLAHLMSGFNKDKYTTLPNGQKVLAQSGKVAVEDQVAKMTGLPSTVVKQMLNDAPQQGARATLQTALGGANESTGIWQFLNGGKKLNNQQYSVAEQKWKDTIDANWSPESGISKKEMARLDNNVKGLRERARQLGSDLAGASKDSKSNQIQQTPDKYTVQIEFKGAAAKLFQVSNISSDKKVSNTGQNSINGILNTDLGFRLGPKAGFGSSATGYGSMPVH